MLFRSPEGNGKTTLMAALGLYGLRFAEGAQIPIAASTRDQIRIMRSLTDDHLQPAWAELLTTMGWQPSTVRAATLEPDEEPEPEAEPAEAEPEETTPPDDEPEHSAEEVDKREEDPPSWQLRR